MIGGKKTKTSNTASPRGNLSDAKNTLGEGSEFEGKLKFEGTVCIDGKFKGEINSTGTLIIGAKAEVEGDITVDSCLIVGKLDGNVTASTKLEMHTPAVVKGNVSSPILIIQEGVTFDGSCQTSGGTVQSAGDSEQAAKKVPEKVSSAPEQPDLIN